MMIRIHVLPFFLFSLLLAAGCISAESDQNHHAATEKSADSHIVRSYAYVLQADALAATRKEAVAILAKCNRDLIVLDACFQADPDGRWTPKELSKIKNAHPGRRIFCYLSIGEAEDYRPYWQTEWDANHDGQPDAAAPEFLLSVNPDWPGNYKVRYWRSEWQTLILQEIDRILAQGFDGLWLDIVDAFEWFEQDGKTIVDNRLNPETHHTYREDMAAWVKTISTHARKQNPNASIIPQNGVQLLTFPAYANTISGLALEDLFTLNNKPQSCKHANYVISFLDPIQKQNKPVFLTEYPTKSKIKKFASTQARKYGMILLLTDRPLKTLGHSSIVAP